MKPISLAANPFNFANPVEDIDLLAGREKQIEEARYYLGQLSLGASATSLALLGERAAGKTSLLNAIEHMALQRDHVVARIDLTEADVLSPAAFWFKTFDQALNASVESGAFGGIGSPFHDAYLKTIMGHGSEVEAEFRIFRSAEEFAHLIHDHAGSGVLQESLIRRDLSMLIEEVNCPLVLLFDECDVLARNEALLQQFRNVFMRQSRCMIVLAATPELFPSMSDTYSPIIRQFKSISVDAFGEFSEVRACISQRLLLAAKQLEVEGKSDNERANRVARWRGVDGFRFAQEVYEASGGLPHQVQLLCHLAFRKYQRGEVDRLTLSVEVLDEATHEIGLTDSAEARPIHRAIVELNDDLRNSLNYLGRCSGKATLEQLALVASVADPDCDWTEDPARRRFDRLEELGLLRRGEAGTIEFCGDSLDRVYARLFARLRGEQLAIGSSSLEDYFSSTIENRTRETLFGRFVWSNPAPPAKVPRLRSLLATVEEFGWRALEMDQETYALLSNHVIFSAPDRRDGQKRVCVLIHAVSQWCETALVMGGGGSDFLEGIGVIEVTEHGVVGGDEVEGESRQQQSVDDVRAAGLALIAKTRKQSGVSLDIDVWEIELLPEDLKRSWIRECGTPKDREHLAGALLAEGVEAYVNGGVDMAVKLFKEATTLATTAEGLNNLGYLELERGNAVGALDSFAQSLEIQPLAILVNYNYALARACLGEVQEALAHAEASLVLEDQQAAVLLVPSLARGKIVIEGHVNDVSSVRNSMDGLIEILRIELTSCEQHGGVPGSDDNSGPGTTEERDGDRSGKPG